MLGKVLGVRLTFSGAKQETGHNDHWKETAPKDGLPFFAHSGLRENRVSRRASSTGAAFPYGGLGWITYCSASATARITSLGNILTITNY